MSAVQRHTAALVAIGLALFVAVGCASGDRTEVALVGADGGAAGGDAPVTAAVTDAQTDPQTDADPASAAAEPSTTASAPPDDSAAVAAEPPAAFAAADDASGDPGAGALSPDADDGGLDQVDAAVADEDICGVYSALARFDLAATSTARLVAQLTRIRDIMVTASAFVAPSLAADWSTVTDGTSDMLESLRRGGSELDGYDDGDYRAASARVGAWMGRNCG